MALISAVGIWKIGNPLAQLHVTSKAGTLGAVAIVLALAVRTGDEMVWDRCLLILLFLVLTGPVASHAIAVAFYAGDDEDEAAESAGGASSAELETKPQAEEPAAS